MARSTQQNDIYSTQDLRIALSGQTYHFTKATRFNRFVSHLFIFKSCTMQQHSTLQHIFQIKVDCK